MHPNEALTSLHKISELLLLSSIHACLHTGRDDTDLITSTAPPQTPEPFLVTLQALGFEAWRASSPRAGFSQGCQHPALSAPPRPHPALSPAPTAPVSSLPQGPPPPILSESYFMSQQHQGLLQGPHALCVSHGLQVARPEPDPPASEASRPARCPSVPAPSISPCGGDDASGPPPRPPAGSDELPPVERPGGQQSSALCSHRMSSEPSFASVAVGRVYVHRAPEGCSQALVVAAAGLTLSLLLVFQDGSYLAEFLLEKGYEVSP